MNRPQILREKAIGESRHEIEDYLFTDGGIWIEGEFTAVKGNLIMSALHYLEDRHVRNEKYDSVTLYINSHGGDAITGLNLYDALIQAEMEPAADNSKLFKRLLGYCQFMTDRK